MSSYDTNPPRTTSEAVTRGIRISVEAAYAPERSAPMQQTWLFLYTVRITNESSDTVQLISRHWIISDAEDHVEEVRGLGVIGEQPVLAPGESFTYMSSCPLSSPLGSMRGTYHMVTDKGDEFESEIAPFQLRAPYAVH